MKGRGKREFHFLCINVIKFFQKKQKKEMVELNKHNVSIIMWIVQMVIKSVVQWAYTKIKHQIGTFYHWK